MTVLDWVANMRLKTPTAVAEWLVGKAEAVLSALVGAGNRILQLASQRIAGNKEQLAQAEALLPVAARGTLERAGGRLTGALVSLSGISAAIIAPSRARLDMAAASLATASGAAVRRQCERIDNCKKLLEVLSPAATLARGYSITRINGHAISSVSEVNPGDLLEITLSDGTFLAHTP